MVSNLVPRAFLRRGEEGPSSPRRRKALGTRLCGLNPIISSVYSFCLFVFSRLRLKECLSETLVVKSFFPLDSVTKKYNTMRETHSQVRMFYLSFSINCSIIMFSGNAAATAIGN